MCAASFFVGGDTGPIRLSWFFVCGLPLVFKSLADGNAMPFFQNKACFLLAVMQYLRLLRAFLDYARGLQYSFTTE